MSDDLKSSVSKWMRDAADAAGEVAKGAADLAKDAVGAISDTYTQSGVQDSLDDAVTWTKERLDRTGVTAVARTISETTGDALDTITGQRILELMEKRNVLQDKYNDVLATKLEEALQRIAALEEVVAKQRSS